MLVRPVALVVLIMMLAMIARVWVSPTNAGGLGFLAFFRWLWGWADISDGRGANDAPGFAKPLVSI